MVRIRALGVRGREFNSHFGPRFLFCPIFCLNFNVSGHLHVSELQGGGLAAYTGSSKIAGNRSLIHTAAGVFALFWLQIIAIVRYISRVFRLFHGQEEENRFSKMCLAFDIHRYKYPTM